MSDKNKALFISFVLIGALGLGYLYFFSFKNEGPGRMVETGPRIGETAPDFSLSTLGGRSVRLTDYKGKVVFLNIWASWCPPCREEMPSMEALHKKFKGRSFEMIAVSIDQSGEETVGSFAAQFGLTFPVLLDPGGKTYRLYGLTGVPETFILDKNGVIVEKIIGPQDWMGKQWLDYFDRIIG
jgi:peroxiredoxin